MEKGHCTAKGTCPYINDYNMAINCDDGNREYWEEDESDERRDYSAD